MSCFTSDLNFCPECGNILPLPGLQNTVRCPRCSFSIPVSGTDERPLSPSGPVCVCGCVCRDFNVTVGVNVCVCSPVCWPCGEMDVLQSRTMSVIWLEWLLLRFLGKSEIVAVCTEFNGQQIRSTVIQNPVEKSAAVVEDEDSDLKGPVVRQLALLGFIGV